MVTEAKTKTKIKLEFIVSGIPVTLHVELDETLAMIFPKATKKADIAGDPKLDEWEFTYDKQQLDVMTPIVQFGFPKDAQIYLNKKAGAAG